MRSVWPRAMTLLKPRPDSTISSKTARAGSSSLGFNDIFASSRSGEVLLGEDEPALVLGARAPAGVIGTDRGGAQDLEPDRFGRVGRRGIERVRRVGQHHQRA